MNSQPVELLVGNVYLIKDGKRLSFTKIDPMEHPKTETDISMSKAVPIGKTELPFKGWTVAMYPPANLVAVSEFPSKPNEFNVHIRNIDSPKKAVDIVTLIYKFDDLGLESLSPPSMSISENTLAISLKVSEMSGQTRFKNRLCVWRWKEGISKEGSIERIKKDELEGVYYAPTLINDVWLIAGKDHKCGDKFNYALHIVNVHNLSEGKTVKLGLPVPTKKYPTFQLRSGASALYEEPRPDSPGTIIMAFMGDSDGDRCFVTAMLIDELLKPPMPEETRRKNTPHEWQSLKEMELKSFTELIEPMPCIPKNSLGLLVSGPNILWPMTKTDEDEFKVSVWKCNLSKGPDSRLKIDGKQYTIHNVDLNKSRVMIVKERVVHIKVIR